MKQIPAIGIILFVEVMLSVFGICWAGLIVEGFEERQHIEITQARIDKGKQRQQKEHLKRLRELCLKFFEDDFIRLYRTRPSVSLSKIREQFGEPIKSEREEWPYWDPDPEGPSSYYRFTWHFDGLLLEMDEHLLSKNEKLVLLRKAVVTSPIYSLKHGLRVGQPASYVIDVFGVPSRKDQRGLITYQYRDKGMRTYKYEDDGKTYEATEEIVGVYEITIGFDAENKVQAIRWEDVAGEEH